jgi:hypothetical protein
MKNVYDKCESSIVLYGCENLVTHGKGRTEIEGV